MSKFSGATADLLTGQQVIERLLGDVRLRRVALTCVLPAVRVGSEWRFRKTDLDEWIKRQSQAPVTPGVTKTRSDPHRRRRDLVSRRRSRIGAA